MLHSERWLCVCLCLFCHSLCVYVACLQYAFKPCHASENPLFCYNPCCVYGNWTAEIFGVLIDKLWFKSYSSYCNNELQPNLLCEFASEQINEWIIIIIMWPIPVGTTIAWCVKRSKFDENALRINATKSESWSNIESISINLIAVSI